MAENLMDVLFSEPIGEFAPYIECSQEADAINVYFKPDPDYSVRMSEHVTLYRSFETHEVVGCRIKGISGIVEDMPNFLHYDKDGVKLRMIFWSFRGEVDNEQSRKDLRELADKAGDLELEPC